MVLLVIPPRAVPIKEKVGGSRLIIYRNYSLLNPDLEDLFLI